MVKERIFLPKNSEVDVIKYKFHRISGEKNHVGGKILEI